MQISLCVLSGLTISLLRSTSKSCCTFSWHPNFLVDENYQDSVRSAIRQECTCLVARVHATCLILWVRTLFVLWKLLRQFVRVETRYTEHLLIVRLQEVEWLHCISTCLSTHNHAEVPLLYAMIVQAWDAWENPLGTCKSRKLVVLQIWLMCDEWESYGHTRFVHPTY